MIELLDCELLNTILKVTYQTNLPWLANLWHNLTWNLNLRKNKPFALNLAMIIDRQFISIQTSSTSAKKCNVVFQVLSATLLPNLKLTDSKNVNITQIGENWFLITGPLKVTWDEAEKMCQKLDAWLPWVTSDEEQEMIKLVIMRSYKDKSYFPNPARCRTFDPLCSVFLGVRKPWVNH